MMNPYEDKPRLLLASVHRTWGLAWKSHNWIFGIYRIETRAPCYKCENKTYSGDESGEAETELLSAQSEEKRNQNEIQD